MATQDWEKATDGLGYFNEDKSLDIETEKDSLNLRICRVACSCRDVLLEKTFKTKEEKMKFIENYINKN